MTARITWTLCRSTLTKFYMNQRQSITVGLTCLASVGLCLLYAATRGQMPSWWRDHGGGVPYVLFWFLLWLTVFPRRSSVKWVSIACVIATCALEVFQLWDGPAWLYNFRRTQFGAALLGYGFDANDLPPYFIGGLVGWVVGRIILRDKKALPDAP